MEPFLIGILVLLLAIVPLCFVIAMALNRKMTADRIIAIVFLCILLTPWSGVIFLEFVELDSED